MITIHQADQYAIAFNVTSDGVQITPENIDSIRIAVGHVVHEFPKGDLTYDGGLWMFPLTAPQTALMSGDTNCQIEVKAMNTRNHSDTFTINVKKSILKGGWNV